MPERRVDLIWAFFGGMLFAVVISLCVASKYVTNLAQQHEASEKSAVHFATAMVKDDLQECERVANGCVRLMVRCVSALGRDSSEPDKIPVEL